MTQKTPDNKTGRRKPIAATTAMISREPYGDMAIGPAPSPIPQPFPTMIRRRTKSKAALRLGERLGPTCPSNIDDDQNTSRS